jgi:hypothetical protein
MQLMQKGRLRGLQVVLIFLFLILNVNFVIADVIEAEKSEYNKGDSIIVDSKVSFGEKLCRSTDLKLDSNVQLFIVEYQDEWRNGDSLDDVRDEGSSEIKNTLFFNKNILTNAQIGKYNLIVDCNDNSDFDNGEDILNEGFSVLAKKGQGEFIIGENSPKDRNWFYDPEETEQKVETLQVKISAKDENIKLNNLNVEFDNPGSQKIDKLEVYLDKDNNGILGSGDNLIGSANPTGVSLVINVDHTIDAGVVENLLFVSNMKENNQKGDYSFTLLTIFGNGEFSEKLIRFVGGSIVSNTITVSGVKTCLGELNLAFNPSSTEIGKRVNARVDNLEGCDGRKVDIQTNACYQLTREVVGNCNLQNGFCLVEFPAINEKYFACIDKNDDGDRSDFGESVVKEIDLTMPVEPVEEKEEKENEEDEEKDVITGKVIEVGEGKEEVSESGRFSFAGTDSFMVLLEVTLLLILFMLILIFFKLRRPEIRDEVFGGEKEDVERGYWEPEKKIDENKKEEEQIEDEKEEDEEKKENDGNVDVTEIKDADEEKKKN